MMLKDAMEIKEYATAYLLTLDMTAVGAKNQRSYRRMVHAKIRKLVDVTQEELILTIVVKMENAIAVILLEGISVINVPIGLVLEERFARIVFAQSTKFKVVGKNVMTIQENVIANHNSQGICVKGVQLDIPNSEQNALMQLKIRQ